MADLSSLMQIAPITGAGFAGINQAQSEQDEQLKQAELAQLIRGRIADQQRLADMHPLDMQNKTLGNQELAARIPGVQATSDLDRTKANVAQGTQASDIAAGNFKNNNGMRQAVFSQLGPYSDALKNQPAVGRHAALDNYISSLGVPDAQRNAMMNHFANVPSEQLPDYVKKVSDVALRSNPDYAKEMDKVKAETASRERVANILADSRVDVAGMRGGGKVDPSDIEGWLRQSNKGKSASVMLGNYNVAITRAQQNGDMELATRLYQEAIPIKQQVDQISNVPRAGMPALGQLSGGQIPTNPAANMPLVSPGQGQQPPQAPFQQAPINSGAAGPSPQLLQALQQNGIKYQPDVYEYQLTPDGRLQRRPKGK